MPEEKITIVLSGGVAEHLKYLARQQAITLDEVIKKAIATESFLYQERRKGSKILLWARDKNLKEVVFKGLILLEKPSINIEEANPPSFWKRFLFLLGL